MLNFKKLLLTFFLIHSALFVHAIVDSAKVSTSIKTSCYDSCDGFAIVQVFSSTSTGPFRIIWRGNSLPGQQSVDTVLLSDTIFNLCGGLFSVEVIDLLDASTKSPIAFSITPGQKMFASFTLNSPACHDSLNGSVLVSMVGGYPGYHFLWSTGNPADTFNLIDSVGTGIYTLTVTDDTGCVFVDSIHLKSPDSLRVNISKTDITCKDKCDGIVQATPVGGTKNYHYQWSSSDTNYLLNNLCPGLFIVEVTDDHGCIAKDSVLLIEPDSLLTTNLISNPDCYGQCDGAVVNISSGGVWPYQYHWSGYTDSDSILNNACEGSITCTVIDANGCFSVDNMVISAPAEIKTNEQILNSNCGICNGGITLFPTGGTGSFTYLWLGQKAEDTIASIDSLCSGVYKVVVQDANLCGDTFSIILNDDTSGIKDIDFITTSSTCANLCDGKILAHVTGGILPYSYLWTPGSTTDSLVSGLCAGQYQVQVTDSAGCKRIEQVTLNSESNMSSTINVAGVSCLGDCNGNADVLVAGGLAPYLYQWTGATTSGSSAAQLCAGSYPVKITDQNNCVLFDTAVVQSGSTLNLVVNNYSTSCYNSCDGSAVISITGGVAPFSIDWDNGNTTDSASGLCSGSHSVVVTDANGCSKTSTFTIAAPAKISLNPIVTNADCNLNNGNVSLSPTGGTSPYQYLWNNNTFANSIQNLAAGVYSVQITDSKNCVEVDSLAVSNVGAPVLNFIVDDESCANSCDGSILVTAVSANSAAQYQWSPGNFANVNSIGGLCPGNYYATVTLNTGCIAVEKVKINPGQPISLGFQSTMPGCGVNCDGGIISTVSGGLPPYQYNWSNNSQQVAISNLCAGTYALTVTDANNCSVTNSVILSNNPDLNVSLSTSNLACYNVCDGKITSIVSGGNGSYQYRWSTGSTGIGENNLCAGKYWLEIIDGLGCIASDTIQIGNGVPIAATFVKTNSGCGLSNGNITVQPTGGNGLPYKYLWNTGSDSTYIDQLVAGLYLVTIEDNSGCEQVFTTTISNVGGPTTSDTVFSASCNSLCDGMAIASGSGAIAPYSIQWNDPQLQLNDTAIGLCAGVYFYSITDSLNCVTYDSVWVNEPSKILINLSANQISCFGGSDGIITTTISGGIPPYDYLWSNGDTLPSTDSLSSGTYWIKVTDSTGCFSLDTVEMLNPAPISASFTVKNNSCFGSCDGLIEVNPSGGMAIYTYLWNDPGNQTGSIATGLCAGYSAVEITDANDCIGKDSALIIAPTTISMSPVLNNPTCFNGFNGSISLTPSGGQAPFTYSWNNGMTGSNISGLKAGTYTVTAISATNCVYQNSYVLNNPPSLVVNFNITKPGCGLGNGSISAIVSGGSGSYGFKWNTIPNKTTSTITNVWAGLYSVEVTDNITGCKLTKKAIVNDATATATSITSVNESCPNACNGQATVHAGSGSFTYLWSNSQKDSTATNLCPGTYNVRITKTGTGCVAYDTITIGSDTFYTRTVNVTPVKCFGDCNGEATVEAIGGQPPITYTWNTIPVQIGVNATALCAGLYTVSSVDSNNCFSGASINIHQPDSITLDVVLIQDVMCFGSCTGRASVAIAGGLPPFHVSWNGLAGGIVSRSLCAGSNSVTVVDANGCSATVGFTVNGNLPMVDNAIVLKPDCQLFNGSISLNPSGGKGPYFYQWSTGAQTSSITDLFSGIYSVRISDIYGCSKTFTYFLSNPNAPLLLFDQNTVDCFGDCNGVARVTTIGGVGPFSYLWNYAPISTKDSLNDLCAGTYFIKVTDANGCIAFGADTVEEPLELLGNLSVISHGCGGQCEGEANLVAIGGTPPYQYNWNSVPPQFLPTATSLCAGPVQVTLTDSRNCTYVGNTSIVPPATLVIDSLVVQNASCFNNSDGEATVYFTGGTAPVGYQWSNAQTTQTAINLSYGQLIVVLTDANGCTTLDTAQILVQDTVLVQAFVDSIKCIGETVTLIAEGTGVTTYQWFIDSSGVLIPVAVGDSIVQTLMDSTIYILRGQNSSVPPCFDLDTSYVIGIPPPIIDAGADVTISKGDFARLLASPYLFNGTYAWTPSAGLNDTAAIDPIARPDVTTIYRVYGTDEFGCIDYDSVIVSVVENDLIINGFSPNGDGVNDYWELPFLKNYPNAIVEVYNRWGNQMFKSETGYKKPWDGKFESKVLPAASYYFVIDLHGNGSDVKTGAVTILF